MTAPTTIDAAGWLGKYLEARDADLDLPRAMLQAFAEALMSAQCGAAYGERSSERENSRNGYGTGRGIPGWARSTWRCRSCGRGRTTRSSS
jgi:putative transposase